jgi:hypothetical protein
MTLEHLDTVIAFAAILAGVSLLVTTLVQMVSALLGLRGANLRWGIATLLKQADPDLSGHATKIAEKVLHHPVISDSTMSDFESDFFSRWKLASAVRKDELVKILQTLGKQAETTAAGQPAPPWASALKNSLDKLDPAAADRLLKLAPVIKQVLPDDPAKADEIISQLTASAEQLTGRVDQWFDAMMDRVAQRFTMHTRIWTVIFSVLIAFAMQLDAFKLLTQLSTDSELRARLVSSADALTKKADEMQATSTNETAVADAAALRQLTNAVGDFHSILSDKLEFQLVPDPYPQPFYNYWTPSWSHFWGIVVSAVLLSLGAPFWFNVLKNLCNLRSVIATKEQQESEAKQEN